MTCACGAPIGEQSRSGRCRSCAAVEMHARIKLRAAPEHDVEIIRAGIAAGQSARQLGEVLGITRKAVLTRAKKYGLSGWQTHLHTGRRASTPADFADFYRVHGHAAAAERYGRSASTIRAWARSAGIGPAPVVAKPKLTSGTVKKWQAFHKPTRLAPVRDASLVGRAAEFLRRFGPVYRCTVRGGADLKGAHWRRGSAVLTGDELVERARALGWSPDEWSRLVA